MQCWHPPIAHVVAVLHRRIELCHHLITRVSFADPAAIWAVVIENRRLDEDLASADRTQQIQGKQGMAQVIKCSKKKDDIEHSQPLLGRFIDSHLDSLATLFIKA